MKNTKTTKKRHYVNNADFYQALVEYRARLKEDENTRIPDYIGVCFSEISRKLSTKANFIAYSYREEMVGDAIENCIMSVMGFDPGKGENPFAYFTQIAWNAMIRRINKEKKQTYLKYKNMQHMHLTSDDNGELHLAHDEIANEIISSFENKLTKPVKKTIRGVDKFVVSDEEIEKELQNEPEAPDPSNSN
jgi:DNA-directed RNA polymerase specialized sigma24 family protein